MLKYFKNPNFYFKAQDFKKKLQILDNQPSTT